MASLLKRLSQQHQKEAKPTREELDSSNSEDDDLNEDLDKQVGSQSASSEDNEAAEENGEIVNIDPENELRAFKDPDPASREWKNRQRTLVVCSRGIAGRMRHLVQDLTDLIPNTKKESKLNRKDAVDVIDEMCFEKSCNNCMFFEQRKQKDLFMWLSKSPVGPSAKFMVTNIHTADELKLSGNCLKFSRPLLSFDEGFD